MQEMAVHRIAIVGFGSESCTFSTLPTRRDDFVVLKGCDIYKRKFAFIPSITSEFGVDFVPIMYARAIPGGPLTKDAYDSISSDIVSGLAVEHAKSPFDGVYLNLHGAMHVVGMEDIECHFVGAVRGVVGGRCLLSASFDLHGNVTEAIAARGMLDMLCAFK
eukprot:Opistho-2@70924